MRTTIYESSRTRHQTGMMVLLASTWVMIQLGLASSGWAAQPGVHIDPNSPAAKEYSIPLGQARGGAAGGSGGSSKLFGSGISRGSGSKSSAATSSSSAPSRRPLASPGATSANPLVHKPANRGDASGTGAVRKASVPPSSADPAAMVDSNQSRGAGVGIEWMLLAAALVLVFGSLAGIALAKRGRRASVRTS
jgi:hypothetical protein